MKKLIQIKTNQQLNQFSNIYFNKIKKNIKIEKYKPIIIVAGEPNSVFLEILFKSFKKKISSPIILICSKKLLIFHMKKFKFKKKVVDLNLNEIDRYIFSNKTINLIDVDYDFHNKFEKNI